jgi:ketosteroid isomerase-like protein
MSFEEFRERHTAALQALNRGDIETMLVDFAADAEWHTQPNFPDRGVARGTDRIKQVFTRWRETFPDYRTAAEEYIDAGHGVFVIRMTGSGTGTSSGAGSVIHFSEVVTMRNGVVVTVREFFDHDEALKAAHLSEVVAEQ